MRLALQVWTPKSVRQAPISYGAEMVDLYRTEAQIYHIDHNHMGMPIIRFADDSTKPFAIFLTYHGTFAMVFLPFTSMTAVIKGNYKLPKRGRKQ